MEAKLGGRGQIQALQIQDGTTWGSLLPHPHCSQPPLLRLGRPWL